MSKTPNKYLELIKSYGFETVPPGDPKVVFVIKRSNQKLTFSKYANHLGYKNATTIVLHNYPTPGGKSWRLSVLSESHFYTGEERVFRGNIKNIKFFRDVLHSTLGEPLKHDL